MREEYGEKTSNILRQFHVQFGSVFTTLNLVLTLSGFCFHLAAPNNSEEMIKQTHYGQRESRRTHEYRRWRHLVISPNGPNYRADGF